MFTCEECKRDCTEADRSPWASLDRCNACMMRRFRIQQLLESRQVIETPGGWATARCMDGTPYEWLCLHIHPTKQKAEECLAGEGTA